MEQNKKPEEISAYKDTKSEFTDYTRFEDIANRRAVERYAFINNYEYTPAYNYPKLDFLIDEGDLTEKKSKIYEAVAELEAAKKYPDANIAELELYAAFHETRLKRILLVETARNLGNPIISNDYEVNRASFEKLNKELYGEFNESYYLGVLDTEKNKLLDFQPKSELEDKIKSELELFFNNINTKNEKEEELLDSDSLNKLHNYVNRRYSSILNTIPNTPDDVYYDASQCVDIMNTTLRVGGLADLGWVTAVNDKKTAVSTNTVKKTISLPVNTHRNADELRRLIMHEQEVHARRGQNGANTGVNILKLGTADCADIEEGLGVMMECAVAGDLNNLSFERARDRYITAGLALGVDGQPRDARETYEILWRMLAVRQAENKDIDEEGIYNMKERAYTLIENAYRGTQFWMKGVIYTKLKVYYEGFVKNAEYFKEHIDTLDFVFDDLLIGKYNHTDRAEKALVKSAIGHKN